MSPAHGTVQAVSHSNMPSGSYPVSRPQQWPHRQHIVDRLQSSVHQRRFEYFVRQEMEECSLHVYLTVFWLFRQESDRKMWSSTKFLSCSQQNLTTLFQLIEI